MSLPLSGKVAIVTGSSRGIGAAVAQRLATDGATVVVNYFSNKAAADEVVDRIKAEGRGSAVVKKADMSSIAESQQLVEDVVKEFGRLDILVLNAGPGVGGTLDTITPEHFDAQVQFHVKAPLFMAQAASKHMTAGGRLVFISSSLTKASLVQPIFLLYAAFKGTIEQIVRVLAKDLGVRGMTVNAVAPSTTDTDMFRAATAMIPQLATEAANMHPQKRIGLPEEIAAVAAFLARDEASWVNGQTIFANGGYVV